MSDDAWVQQAVADGGACPWCRSDDVRPVVYGMPVLDEVERLGDRVDFAGCCVPPDPPTYRCGACGWGWGRAALG